MSGPKRDTGLERAVVYKRMVKKQSFGKIGKKYGFSRQRAYSIYKRYMDDLTRNGDT